MEHAVWTYVHNTLLYKSNPCIYQWKQHDTPDSKVHGANMGPIWGRQDPGGPHIGPMNFAIWDLATLMNTLWAQYKENLIFLHPYALAINQSR